jgi:hypothetical protein
MNATAKQIDYLESLKAEAAKKIEATGRGVVLGRSQLVAAHLIANLPAPVTSEEASEMIAAAKGDIQNYSRNHREWAEPIVRAAMGN